MREEIEEQFVSQTPSEPGKHHSHHGDPSERPRHGAGRVIAYFIVLIVLNVLLAVYTLYMLGYALAFNWSILKAGSIQVILESALQLLLLFSPVILSILTNRLLYRAFRGWRRFPRGTWFFAFLAILAVQTATIMVIFGYGYVDGANGLNIETIGSKIANP
jgi:magnesium-transporting ATPase (P-type)